MWANLPLLLADGGIDVSTALMAGGSAAGSVGFAVWYAWHVTTKTIPDKDNAHAAERKELIEAHAAERKEMEERHDKQINGLLAELKEVREGRKAGRTGQ